MITMHVTSCMHDSESLSVTVCGHPICTGHPARLVQSDLMCSLHDTMRSVIIAWDGCCT